MPIEKVKDGQRICFWTCNMLYNHLNSNQLISFVELLTQACPSLELHVTAL